MHGFFWNAACHLTTPEPVAEGVPMSSLYPLYDALVSINVPADKARAVVDSVERDMLTHLATKSDLDALRRELRADLALVRQESRADNALLRQSLESGLSALRVHVDSAASSLRQDMTIWLGSVQIIGMGLLFAALKLT